MPRPGERCIFSRFQEDLSHDVPKSDTAAWRAVARVLRSPLNSVSCALFPGSCRICGNPLLRLGRIPVCEICIAPPSSPSQNRCNVCGEYFGLDSFPGQQLSQPVRCRACEAVPPPFTTAVSLGAYTGNLRALIHLLKYEGIAPVARPLGKLLAEAIAQIEPRLVAHTIVVAVPLHPVKQRQRGFNQAERMARAALAEIRRMRSARSSILRLEMRTDVLERAKPTDSQFGLTASQRRKNLKGAFKVARAGAIAGKTVLLIDDIYTSGATARECSRTLLAAGAAEVYVATLARAQWDGVAHWGATQFVATPITFQTGESRLATRL